LEAAFPTGWTGIVGANGTGKTTLLKLAAGILKPTHGAIRRPGSVRLCEQRTDEPPRDFADLLGAHDGSAAELRGRLALQDEWSSRWSTLSHGERKRAQIAVALWQNDPVLCLDEPTNHVDADARALLAEALARYRGVGLLVSHDRELLDSLCTQCLFLDPPRTVLRPGSWSQGREQQQREAQSLRRKAELARTDVRRITGSVAEAKAEAARSRRRMSKRGLRRKDKDAKGRIDLARLTGKDAVTGRLVKRLEANLDRAVRKSAEFAPRPGRELGLWFSSEPARRDTLLDLPAGSLPLGGSAMLSFPDLALRPLDRVALVGPNGYGKSTLLAYLVGALRLEPERLLYLPQEIDLDESAAALDRLHGMSDRDLGRALTVVELLGTDAKRLLATGDPSPGEIRKVLIAIGIARVPHLIVLDEPTNHLDLPSVECLEEALAACDCGLILASHDRRFLARLTGIRWEIGRGEREGERSLRVVLAGG
jgi:macrolide transport system ATP-binding/permease protein